MMNGSDPDYLVTIQGLEEQSDGGVFTAQKRRWIGVRFDCCNVYHRIYKSKCGQYYRGRCPRCLREVSVRVGAGGTDCRFFVAE